MKFCYMNVQSCNAIFLAENGKFSFDKTELLLINDCREKQQLVRHDFWLLHNLTSSCYHNDDMQL